MEKETIKGIRKFQVSERESDILYALWNAERPLMASEIANEELKLTTVHTTLKRMLAKNLVEVVDFAKSGNVFGRCYQPTISMMEFEMDKFASGFVKRNEKEVTITDLLEVLFQDADKETLKRELDDLEQLIKEMREEMEKSQQGTL